MDLKPVLLFLACLLLINTKVSSDKEEQITSVEVEIVVANKSSPPPPSPLPPLKPSLSPPPPPPAKASPPPPFNAKPPRNIQECIPLCVVRCELQSRKNVCLRACLTCCDRCKCVPPGQYGNKEKCGKCYAGMTTTGGKLKCP